MNALRRAVAALLLCLPVGIDAAAWAGAPLSAVFDHEMQERFALPPLGTGLGDEAGEIYTDPPPSPGSENDFIAPSAWTVHFDACASSGAIAEYRWVVDGNAVGSETGCSDFSFDFASLGRHSVTLTVVDAQDGSAQSARDIVLVDLLIVSLGDSFASGEGAPDRAIGQAEITAAEAAEASFASAESDAAAKAAALQQALAQLAQLQTQVDALLGLLQDFLDAAEACPNPPLCAPAALANLAAATLALTNGLEGLGLFGVVLDVDDPAAVTNALAGLLATANGLVTDAQNADALAQQALGVAQSNLDAALIALEPSWRNRRCHRSANAGPVRAAQALAEADPHSTVTFIHLACSGASIPSGLLGPYAGIDPVGLNTSPGFLGPPIALLPPQLERARELVCGVACDASDREVDAFLVSIGGNDVNFGAIIETCIVGEPCHDDPIPDGTAGVAFDLLCAALGPFTSACDDFYAGLMTFDAATAFFDGRNEPPPNGLDDLPGHYQSLQTALANEFGPGAAAALHLTEYPDVTRDESEALCGWQITQPIAEQLRNLPGVSPAEMSWADAVVQTQLAAAMQSAASLHGWRYVGGLRDAFSAHGYCAADNWINRVQESFLTQGGVEGGVHPTARGYDAYRDAILVALPEPGATPLLAAATLVLVGLVRARRPRGTR